MLGRQLIECFEFYLGDIEVAISNPGPAIKYCINIILLIVSSFRSRYAVGFYS